jgi:maltose O-acetyltransferase
MVLDHGLTRALVRRIAAALYYLIARHLPPTNVPTGRVSTRLRVALVRQLVDELGANIDISRAVYIGLGRGISIGSESGIGVGCELHGPLTIGDHVMVSPHVMIHTRNHRFSDTQIPISKQGYSDPRRVVIEDDVWIGARSIILPGVTISHGSVIGAGTVVAKSVPPYSVVAGNPGRVIRSRSATA